MFKIDHSAGGFSTREKDIEIQKGDFTEALKKNDTEAFQRLITKPIEDKQGDFSTMARTMLHGRCRFIAAESGGMQERKAFSEQMQTLFEQEEFDQLQSTVENALAHRTFPGYRYSVMLEGLRDALRMRNKPTQEMQPR